MIIIKNPLALYCKRRSDFVQDAFKNCGHISNVLDIQGPELHRGHKNKIQYLICIVICPKKFTPTMCLKSWNFVTLELMF